MSAQTRRKVMEASGLTDLEFRVLMHMADYSARFTVARLPLELVARRCETTTAVVRITAEKLRKDGRLHGTVIDDRFHGEIVL